MKGGGDEMNEAGERIGQLGMLIRQPDGSPIVVEYTDTQIEMDPRRGERRPSRESFTPRFNSPLSLGTLVEIPGGGLFKVSKPLRGQEMPNSVYAERISQSEFERERNKGVQIKMPDNLRDMKGMPFK